MKSIEGAHAHDHAGDEHAHDAEQSRRLSRKIARKASGASSASPSGGDTGARGMFGAAINTGIHSLISRKGDVDTAGGADRLVARAAEGSGHALPGALRERFEGSLGTDLGGVRVHTHGAASDASAALGAKAYAIGQDVFMGAGQYTPETPGGAWLLAHEVAHTVQQRGSSSGPQTKLEVSEAGDAMETAADVAADAMLAGTPTTVGSAQTSIARVEHGHDEGGHGHAAGALTPPQQRALQAVQHGGRALHLQSREQLLNLVTTLTAAWRAAPPHTENRRTTAAALVRLYDAFDEHLGDEFARGGEPMMAWEVPELSMIDPWVQDAGEASHRRHLPHRRHQPRPAAPTGGGVQPMPNAPAPPTPTTPLPNRVEGLPSPEAPEQAGRAGHIGTLAVEFFGGLAEIAAHSMAGGLSAALASVYGAFQSLHSGDEFDHHISEGQARVFNYCSAFAHAARGEPGGSGEGASAGAQAAGRLREQYLAQGGDPAALSHASFLRLYGIAWRSIISDIVRRMEDSLTPGFATTGYSRGVVRERMMMTAPAGAYYNAHGGE